MSGPLYDLLPPTDDFNSDDLLGRFLEYVAGKGLTLHPAQEKGLDQGSRWWPRPCTLTRRGIPRPSGSGA
jgi:hypothetical protein